MGFFKTNNEELIINGLLNVKSDDDMFNSFTVLQNEISVNFPAKVIAVLGVKNDKLATAFAKALADSYAKNGSSCLLIDANLYNPSLKGLLGNASSDVEFKDNDTNKSFRLEKLDDMTSVACMDKEIYPSNIYKAGAVQQLIKENEKSFEHFIVVMPSIKEHKEIVLIKDVVDSIILVTQKDITIKEHVYNAVQFFAYNELPLAKTVVLK